MCKCAHYASPDAPITITFRVVDFSCLHLCLLSIIGCKFCVWIKARGDHQKQKQITSGSRSYDSSGSGRSISRLSQNAVPTSLLILHVTRYQLLKADPLFILLNLTLTARHAVLSNIGIFRAYIYVILRLILTQQPMLY